MSTLQLVNGNVLKNTVVSLLQSTLPSVSKLNLNNVNVSQRRNKSTNLDKDLAQNIFFSQQVSFYYLSIIIIKDAMKNKYYFYIY